MPDDGYNFYLYLFTYFTNDHFLHYHLYQAIFRALSGVRTYCFFFGMHYFHWLPCKGRGFLMRIPILFNYFLSIFVLFLFIYRYPRNHEGSFPPLKETMTTRSLRRIIASLSGSHECWIINRCCSYWIGCI